MLRRSKRCIDFDPLIPSSRKLQAPFLKRFLTFNLFLPENSAVNTLFLPFSKMPKISFFLLSDFSNLCDTFKNTILMPSFVKEDMLLSLLSSLLAFFVLNSLSMNQMCIQDSLIVLPPVMLQLFLQGLIRYSQMRSLLDRF